MNGGVIGRLSGTAAVFVIALSACSSGGTLSIRPTKSAYAPGEMPVTYRVAEARAHFRLGNVALALEGFRKALREDPNSVDALNGMAACYDRMGRFDLSRHNYEQALALAPGDQRLYVNLATSLELQGRSAEASAVRREIQQRFASAPVAPAVPLAAKITPPAVAAPATAIATVAAQALPALPMSLPSLPERSVHIPAPQIAIDLPDLRASQPAQTASAAAVAEQERSVPAGFSELSRRASGEGTDGSARLERLSLGEVALVTAARPVWKARVVERSERSTTIAFARLPQRRNPAQAVVLLNAARVEGLAARTRSQLAARGWRQVAIGNARRVERQSTILYPAERRVLAERLSRQFGFPLRQQPAPHGQIIVLLGRDSAAPRRPSARRA